MHGALAAIERRRVRRPREVPRDVVGAPREERHRITTAVTVAASLIELMIAVAMLGILAAISIPALSNSTRRAKLPFGPKTAPQDLGLGGRVMQIHINTDHNIQSNSSLAAHVRGMVASSLDRFSDQITYVEVHLSGNNGGNAGPYDKQCMMEARLEGRRPTAVTHRASTVDEAVVGATGKLEQSIQGTLGPRADKRS
jgi:hypothetical protein